MEQNSPRTRNKGNFTKPNSLHDLASSLGKLPPQNLEAEEAVLGALMLEKGSMPIVQEILRPDSFYKEAHRIIYEAIISLDMKGDPVDLLTVTNYLRKSTQLDFVGGPYFLVELTQRVSSAANLEFHARIVSENSIKRELIKISSEITRDSFDYTSDVFELLDHAQQQIFQIVDNNLKKKYASIRDILHLAIQELETKKNSDGGLTGVPTGFTDLDRLTSGWQKSDLVIIAARPGMGKCLGKGTKVLMFDGRLKNVEDVKEGELLMGDDNTPRKVLSLATGREQMYWIRQNKGIDYRVNESHILSLKRSRNEGQKKHGEVLNISVLDYQSKSKKFQNNFKGYKVAIDFEEVEVPLEPYYLGIWLGDGRNSDPRITNTDKEVVAELNTYADKLGLHVSSYEYPKKAPTYSITAGYIGVHDFSIKDELRKLNLLENKHIPQLYLSNSQKVRLELLAGLLDSDGHFDPQANGFEITQKNEQFAHNIKFLCDSLGFRTSLIAKKATIKKIHYETTVYRVRIFGNIDSIPTRIKRKQVPIFPTPKRVDWTMTGISIEKDIVDDYYGFEIDGNKLFLLEDMTVTHNTAFVVSAMRNAAVQFGKPVAMFSLEMSSVQLINRLISAEAELASEKITKGRLEPYEWQQLHERISKLNDAPIYIDDTPALSIMELRAKCRQLKAQYDIQLIIIDYLQLMRGSDIGKGMTNREQEIATISRNLKGLAKELSVPVIALSQLSRATEQRGGDKRPMLSDLRESGSIEQDADMVMFLYRPEYYGIEVDEDNNPTKGVGEVIIAKHRNGSLDTVKLRFIGQFTKFADLDKDFSDSGTSEAGGNSWGSFPPTAGGQEFITLPSKMNNDKGKNDGFGIEDKFGGGDEVPF
jgi:replicative DNA helicase